MSTPTFTGMLMSPPLVPRLKWPKKLPATRFSGVVEAIEVLGTGFLSHPENAELRAKVLAMPTSDQIPFDVNTNLIVEFYR